MKFVQAGDQQLIALEPDEDLVREVVEKAGFQVRFEHNERALIAEVESSDKDDPLLLFDASDLANLGWFSRCQFYVDGFTGNVLQTPLTIANCRDEEGRLLPSLRVSMAKELPVHFRLPGSQKVTERVVYALLYHFLSALRGNGVAVCGQGAVTPLAGRTQTVGARN